MWLFPAFYLLHITEEYFGGFQQWISRIWDVESSNANFLIWNGVAFLLMITGIVLVFRTRSLRWLIVAYGTVVLINGLAHAIGSIMTTTYSPGLISGSLLFVPLGIFTLRRGWAVVNRRSFRAGVIVGVAMHVGVVMLAFGFARISG